LLELNNIYHGDCFSLLDELEPDIIDCVVTSPPYNIGKIYGDYNTDDKPRMEYMNWINKIFYKIYQKLKPDGSVFLNLGNRPSDQMFCHEVIDQLTTYFELQNTIIWVKSIDGKGHFKPISSDRFLNDCFEYVFHLTKSKSVKLDKLSIGVEYTDKTNIKRWSKNKDVRDRGNVWFIPYKTKNIKDKHPTMFPEKLPEMCIKLHGIKEKNMVVLDPFCGSGTVPFVVKQLGVNFIGMELEQEYVKMSKLRNNIIPSMTR
jgi:site-specific DNA-methyltransferase (adenine-specific)